MSIRLCVVLTCTRPVYRQPASTVFPLLHTMVETKEPEETATLVLVALLLLWLLITVSVIRLPRTRRLRLHLSIKRF